MERVSFWQAIRVFISGCCSFNQETKKMLLKLQTICCSVLIDGRINWVVWGWILKNWVFPRCPEIEPSAAGQDSLASLKILCQPVSPLGQKAAHRCPRQTHAEYLRRIQSKWGNWESVRRAKCHRNWLGFLETGWTCWMTGNLPLWPWTS